MTTAKVVSPPKTLARKTVNSVQKAPTVEVESADERHAYVPAAGVASSYVHRTIGGQEDFKLFDYCMKNRMNILMQGPTGSGKTHALAAYAAARGLNYYAVPCDVSLEPSALFGKMTVGDSVGEFRWQDGPVTEIVRKGGVLIVSEINMMPARVASSLYSVFDNRRNVALLAHHGEVVDAHPDTLFVADMNPNYRGTQELNYALANRFPVKLDWGYLDEVEKKLVSSETIHQLGTSLRRMGQEIRTPVSTNMLMEFQTLALDLGMAFASASFVNSFAAGEREAVKRVVDASSVEIAKELTEMRVKAGGSTADDLTLPEDVSWYKESNIDPSNYRIEDEA